MLKKKIGVFILVLLTAVALLLGGLYLYRHARIQENPTHGVLVLREAW